MAEQSTYRAVILAETLEFVKQACKLEGIKRISLIGSLTRESFYPKDVDLLIRVTDETDLAPLAKMKRQLNGRLQHKRNNAGVDAFLANPRGKYLGRICLWSICEFRGDCGAWNCAKRPYLRDDFGNIKLKHGLILYPPVDLWPKVVRREVLPEDTEDILVQPLEIMIRDEKNKKVSSSWESTEKIVAFIEQAISPDAKVEHNVKLPVINNPNRKPRQCDVVITFGKYPRQTLAIVEVQKRVTRPSITTFHGWCKKMEEVGAQHLFCVSALGYPSSIIEYVKKEKGPTVKLLTLEDLGKEKKLNGFFPTSDYELTFINPEYEILDIGHLKLVNIDDRKEQDPNLEADCFDAYELNFDSNAKSLSIANDSNFTSLNNILNTILLPTIKDIISSSSNLEVNLSSHFPELYL
ncbi:MAG: hypothetical protein VKL42_16600 [Snowella sp.]|nr:hypothetical protein [Snowella sp.]